MLILTPFFLVLAKMLTRVAPDVAIKTLAIQFLIVGILYPCVAGLDPDRQSLYLNLCAVGFLGFTAWVLAARLLNRPLEQTSADTAAQPV